MGIPIIQEPINKLKKKPTPLKKVVKTVKKAVKVIRSR